MVHQRHHPLYYYLFFIQTIFILSYTFPTPSKRYHYNAPNDKRFDPTYKKFHASGGIIYQTSLLTPQEFSLVQDDVDSHIKNKGMVAEKNSIAMKRKGLALPSDSETVKLLQSNGCSLTKYMNKLCENDDEFVLAENMDVEVREYSERGSCMEWHTDDVMYNPPQIEVVFTLENDSDCVTSWKTNGSNVLLQEVETDANSAIVLKAGGVEHRVSALKYGCRRILKCVYTSKSATKLASSVEVQSGFLQKNKKRR